MHACIYTHTHKHTQVVGDSFNEGIYDLHVRLKRYPVMPEETPRSREHLMACDIATKQVHIHRQTDRQTDRHTHTHTHTHTPTHMYREHRMACGITSKQVMCVCLCVCVCVCVCVSIQIHTRAHTHTHQVHKVCEYERVSTLVSLLQNTRHHGFPVTAYTARLRAPSSHSTATEDGMALAGDGVCVCMCVCVCVRARACVRAW